MMIAQKLYENGHITYMRTDSVTISTEILDSIEKYIVNEYGVKYKNKKQYSNKSKNAQEAHECIRPCSIDLCDLSKIKSDKYNINDIKIYNLIWKRTIVCQMSDCILNNLTLNINIQNSKKYFIVKSQKVLFDGFTKLYKSQEDLEKSEKNLKYKNYVIKIIMIF